MKDDIVANGKLTNFKQYLSNGTCLNENLYQNTTFFLQASCVKEENELRMRNIIGLTYVALGVLGLAWYYILLSIGLPQNLKIFKKVS